MNNFKLEVEMMKLEIEVTTVASYEYDLFKILYDALRSIDSINFNVFGILFKSKRRLKVKGSYTLPNYIKILCRINKDMVVKFLECNPRFKETFISRIVDDDSLKNKKKRYTFDEARNKIAKSIGYIHPYWVRFNMGKYLTHEIYSDLDILVLTDIIDQAYRSRNKLRVENFPMSMYDLKDLVKLINSKEFINESVDYIDTAHRKVEGTPYCVRFPKMILEYWEFYGIVNSAIESSLLESAT